MVEQAAGKVRRPIADQMLAFDHRRPFADQRLGQIVRQQGHVATGAQHGGKISFQCIDQCGGEPAEGAHVGSG